VLRVAVLVVRTFEGFVDQWRFKAVVMCFKTFHYPSLIGPPSLPSRNEVQNDKPFFHLLGILEGEMGLSQSFDLHKETQTCP